LDAIKAEETGEPSTPSQSIHTLSNNYPNPFNLKTNITYNIKTNSHVEIYVYDIEGKKRACLIDKQLAPDEYSLEWNASSFASGIYFIQLRVDEQISDVEKVSLIK
jgi:hypothetical protein